jgi:hypothetical protein
MLATPNAALSRRARLDPPTPPPEAAAALVTVFLLACFSASGATHPYHSLGYDVSDATYRGEPAISSGGASLLSVRHWLAKGSPHAIQQDSDRWGRRPDDRAAGFRQSDSATIASSSVLI